MTRTELLQELLRFEGISRSVLEQRIRDLAKVFDAAVELVAADNVAQATGDEVRYENAWDTMRMVVRASVRRLSLRSPTSVDKR